MVVCALVRAVLLVVIHLQYLLLLYLEIKGWCGFRDKYTHGLTEAQAREIITEAVTGNWS